MKMTLMQHFRELRRRVLWLILIFLIAFGAGWILSPYLQEFLAAPLFSVWPGGEMLYTGLSDGLMIQFSLSTLVALFVSIPALLWHGWAFVAPGLHKSEKKVIAPILIMSPILFLAGAAFAYFILFPLVFKFFVELNLTGSVPSILLPAIRDYLSLSIGLLKVFGIAFQLPLVLVLLNRVGILSKDAVIKSRRYAVVGVFVLSAILTPPDIVSQTILALPLLVLFEISILFMKK